MVRNRVPTEKWLIWCELNDEQDALEVALRVEGISYVSVRGNTDLDKRVDYERAWRLGNVQVMISKPSVFGWGLNWQHCARMAFVGVTDYSRLLVDNQALEAYEDLLETLTAYLSDILQLIRLASLSTEPPVS